MMFSITRETLVFTRGTRDLLYEFISRGTFAPQPHIKFQYLFHGSFMIHLSGFLTICVTFFQGRGHLSKKLVSPVTRFSWVCIYLKKLVSPVTRFPRVCTMCIIIERLQPSCPSRFKEILGRQSFDGQSIFFSFVEN